MLAWCTKAILGSEVLKICLDMIRGFPRIGAAWASHSIMKCLATSLPIMSLAMAENQNIGDFIFTYTFCTKIL